MHEYDFVIIGQGLAGTTLAWELLRADQRVLVLDRHEPVTSSRIAAGLMTPVTGKRFVQSDDWATAFPIAKQFYQSLERELNASFFYEVRMVRSFASETEHATFSQKTFAESIRAPSPPLDPTEFDAPWGAFEMTDAARLDVPAYLEHSRESFLARHAYRQVDVDLVDDIFPHGRGLEITSLDIVTQNVVLCRGFDEPDLWFGMVPFDATRGDILTVRIPGLREQRIVHRGIWIVPLGDELFRVGATHDRIDLENIPSPAGRAELCEKLTSFLKLPYEVVDHQAAVRPILKGRTPLIGRHRRLTNCAYFNGLGSKGSLLAPWLAQQLARHLVRDEPIDARFDLNLHFGD